TSRVRSVENRRDSMSLECRRVTGGMLPLRIPVVLVGLARWNAQVGPFSAAERLRDVHDLADMVSQMRQRAMQRLVNLERLRSDRHCIVELPVAELGQRSQERRPTVFPLLDELGLRHRARLKFLLTMTPRFF